MQGLADEQHNDIPTLRYRFQSGEIIAHPCSMQCINALGRDSKFIADRQTDAFPADV